MTILSASDSVGVSNRLIGVNLEILIAHIISSVFLIIILTYLVYKPFRKWIKKRENKLKDERNLSEKLLKNAEELQLKTKNKVIKTKNLIENMLLETKAKSNFDKKQILYEANAESEKIIEDAKLVSQQQKIAVKDDIQKAIISNSISLTEKLLKVKVDPQKHQKLINDFIDKMGEIK